MSQKPEIEKFRVYHDLHTQFEIPEAISKALQAQLTLDDQTRIERFVNGFKIEDLFEWVFCVMPWIKLIHGLDQQQFPSQSKDEYQVPDFQLLVETSALEIRPLLVEVKRVPKEKTTLALQETQVQLCEKYATTLKIPLVYAIYWEKFNAWTLNTPDVFNRKSSSRKLPLTLAFESDCGAILGDISYLVPPTLVRNSRYSSQNITIDSVQHSKYGMCLSDVVSLGERKVEMNGLESAAIDSMLTMLTIDVQNHNNGETELTEKPDNFYILKRSSWIVRHLAAFGVQPSEQVSNASAHVISDLAEKLACLTLHAFPEKRSKQMEQLNEIFRTDAETPATDQISQEL